MLKRVPYLLAAAALILAAVSPRAAESASRVERSSATRPVPNAPTDACGTDGAEGRQTTSWRAQLDRATAIHIVEHTRRACRGLIGLVEQYRSLFDDKGIAPRIAAVMNRLRAGTLEPIYGAHPSLRTGSMTKRDVRRGNIARGTAVRLRKELSETQAELTEAFSEVGDLVPTKDEAMALIERIADVTAEFGFASAPIYKSFPDIWNAEAKALMMKVATSGRTEESDTGFRKSMPPAGTVKLSARAMTVVRRFMAAVRRAGDGDALASIMWVEEAGSKGPNDNEWRRSGPGLSLGSYSARQVPPDVIETISGVKLVFSAPDPSIFAGKIIDYQNQRFVLTPRS